MNRPDNIIPLHRGTYQPPFPRYVRPHTGEQLSRMVGDPDAAFRRFDGPPVREVIGDADEGFAQAILSLIRENFAAATLGFLFGFAPFVGMLVYMVRS